LASTSCTVEGLCIAARGFERRWSKIPAMSGDYWPFLGRQAVRRGEISAWQLQRDYRAVHRNVYLSKRATLTALTRARAAWLWSGGDTTLTGLSAAAVLATQ
jgi:hypothetical protein